MEQALLLQTQVLAFFTFGVLEGGRLTKQIWNHMRLQALLSGVILTSLSGCMSLSSMHMARTLRPGEVSASLGLGYQSVDVKKESSDEFSRSIERAIEDIKIPILEGGLRYGVGTGFELGSRLALIPGTIGVDAKYLLLGRDGKFAMSLGLALDYSSYSLGGKSSDSDDGDSSSSSGTTSAGKSKISLTKTSLPLYLSYDVSDFFTGYFTPRMGVMNVAASGTSKSYSGQFSTAGFSAGALLGSCIVEFSYEDQMNGSNLANYQWMIGWFIGKDRLDHGKKKVSASNRQRGRHYRARSARFSTGKP